MEPETTVEHEVIDISPIVTMAAEKSVLSIGVGDHGNEIGFGRIVDTVAATMPNGDKLCTCVGTDILLPAMMSNWGCYGIEAALAFLLKRPKIVHSPAQEERIIRACQMAGGIDAIYACTEFGVDGLDGDIDGLHAIPRQHRAEVARRSRHGCSSLIDRCGGGTIFRLPPHPVFSAHR